MDRNQQLYNTEGSVKEYRRASGLTPPEQTILELVKPLAAGQDMLDIGIGTGRTTKYFAPLFRSYTGIDYSSAMTEESRRRFGNLPNTTFITGDARNMRFFEDGRFDFMLFSFNGIDCMKAEERTQVFSEIRRIGRAPFLFAFSTHNYYYIPRLFSFQYPRNPLKYPREFRRHKGMAVHNPPVEILLKEEYASIRDGDQNFEAEYIYCRPDAQIRDLQKEGFKDIRVFSLKTGKEFSAHTDFSRHDDEWFYYLCKD
jgi:SAM-dependent methyltransferase